MSNVVGIATSKERLRQQLRDPLYGNALYLAINSATIALVGLLFWLVAARLYADEDVGLASAAISATMLLALLSTMGLDYGIIRFLPSSGEGSNAMINSCLTIAGLASIIITLIFIAGLGFWSSALLFLRQDPVFLYPFIAFTVASTLSMLLERTFVAKRRASFILAQGLIFNLLRLTLVILLAVFFAAFGIFASWGIGAMVALVIGILLFLPRAHGGYRPSPAIRRKVVDKMVHFSVANYIAALLWFAPTFILPLMVVNLVGAEANAYFYIAWAIANVLFAIPLGASFSLFAAGSYEEQRLIWDTRRSLNLSFFLLIPAIVLIFLIGDKLLILFAPAYEENATKLLWILAVSAVPVCVNVVYFGVKRVEMKMKSVIVFTAFIAIGTLALSRVLLPQMGIVGAGVAWLSSQGAVALVIIAGSGYKRLASRWRG